MTETAPSNRPMPRVTDRATWQARIDELRVKEKAHTRAGDALAAERCEGCTFSTTHINELSYLNSRDVSYATFGQGPYEESSRHRDFMGWTVPRYSVPQDAVDRLVADRNFDDLGRTADGGRQQSG